MSTTGDHHNHALGEQVDELLRNYYRDEIATLAQSFPRDQKSLVVDYQDVYERGPDLADDLLANPSAFIEVLEEQLRHTEASGEQDLSDAHVRVSNLPAPYTYYPGEFSPSEHRGTLRAIEGEISKATDDYARMETAVFECQRCGTPTEMPQADGEFQEPHECQGCERQGPFQIDYEQSEFVDAQKLRIQTPPEEAQGEGTDVDVFVEDDYADRVTAGDRVTVTGIIRLEQQTNGSKAQNKFAPYIEGVHIEVDQTDARDVDVTPEQRERIEALANGKEGDPLKLAADSLAPKIYGYDQVKQAIVLALVGGSRVEYEGDDFDRGEFHVLLIGDPSTAKSKLVQRAEQVGWRSVGVSGRGATVAGVTATAVQDDFGDGSWSLDAGAAVKAHRGVLAIDELDDMPVEVRSALLEPMSKQTIHITKGGINTHLETRTAVVAAANPKHDRFDPYEALSEQFDLSGTLLSRFDLVYTFRDEPDETMDERIGRHILSTRNAAKRVNRGDDVEDLDTDPRGPIDPETVRAWIALAKQQPEPAWESEAVEDAILDRFTELRGLYGYDEDDPVPVAWRSLEGIVRVAEAAAKFEFSETITEAHVETALGLLGQSLQDAGKDPETGELDADVKESGRSTSQKDRKQAVKKAIKRATAESDESYAEVDDVVEMLEGTYDPGKVRNEIENFYDNGNVTYPRGRGTVRYLGDY